MRIVIYSDYFSERMGYSENVLPALMAARGHEVFFVTSTMQIYGDAPYYNEVYGKFLGPARVEPYRKKVNGVEVIRLPIFCWWKRFRLTRGGLSEVLRLKPDVVQTFDPRSMMTVLLSLASWIFRFRLFTSEHSLASVYPAYYSYAKWNLGQRLYLRLTETALGWIAARRVSVCYATTPDAAEIAVRFHGLRPGCIRHLPLGVDTGLFRPPASEADMAQRNELRQRLGVMSDEILCIYTGRFTKAKNPLCLAQAIVRLRARGMRFRALFLGEGEQGAEIASSAGSMVKAFIPYPELPGYFRAADIGVWPCQESISMLDAAACSLPIVVGDRLKARERIEGNGVTYVENDAQSLSECLERLRNQSARFELGSVGAKKMQDSFGIDRVIDVMLSDYAATNRSG